MVKPFKLAKLLIKGAQRGYSSKPLNIALLNVFSSWKSSDPKIIGIKTYFLENFGQEKALENYRWPFLGSKSVKNG